MPKLWWSPTMGLIRGGTNGNYEDAVRLVPETEVVAYLREEAQRAARMDVPAAHQWLTECADELEAGT